MNKDSTASAKTVPAISFLHVSLVTVLACAFFGVVAPTPSNSVAVIAGSITLGAVIYVWSAFFVRLFAALWPFPTRQQRVLAATLTLAVMFLILMQSIGELSWRDALAAIPLAIILYAYATYVSRGLSTQGHPGALG